MASISERTTSTGATRYRVTYRANGRKSPQRVKTFATRKHAEKWAALLEAVGPAKAEEALTVPAAAVERTVGEQVAHHIEHLPNITAGTRSDYLTYAKDIEAYLGGLPLSLLTRDDVTRFGMVLRSERRLSHKSIKHRHSLLSSALRSAVRADLLGRNVAEGVELPRDGLEQTREMVALTVDQVRFMLEVTAPHWRPLVATLVGTGMRVGEASALQVADLDLVGGSCRVRRAWKHTDSAVKELGLPKTGPREIHVGSLARVLEPLCVGRGPSEFVFSNTRGGVVVPKSFHDRPWGWIRGALLGEFGVSPRVHDLRHTYATIQLREGKSLAWLQRQLGHRSIETTTRVYGHLRVEDLAGLGDVLDWPVALGLPVPQGGLGGR